MTDLTVFAALQELFQNEDLSFHMPGHKGGPEGPLGLWLGDILRYDQTEIGPLDNIHDPSGPIYNSERQVAALYGTKATYFTTNGSSAGLIAALLASAPSGAEVIVPRNAHKAILSGLILGDYLPRFVAPLWQDGFFLGVSPESLQAQLAAYPAVDTVVLVHPSYEGVGGGLAELVQIARAAHCRVVVDEAHGAHFAFHKALPPSAVHSGADWVVQSAHKTLSALTGAAWVHRLNDNFSDECLRSRLSLVQSTSPSWLLLASLDLAGQELREQGEAKLNRAIAQVSELVAAIEKHSPLVQWLPPRGFQQDLLKVNLLTRDLGYSGYELAQHLESQGIYAEMAKEHSLLLMFTLADADRSFDHLLSCLGRLRPGKPSSGAGALGPPPMPKAVMRPRAAYLAPVQRVSEEGAVGRVAARPVYAYPPGIPLIYPGEEVNRELLDYVHEHRAKKGQLNGLSGQSWSVVAEREW